MSFIPLSELKTSTANKSPAITPHPSPFTSSQRLPPWFKVQAKTGPDYLDIKQTMDRLKLHTICEEARCPNRWECWNARTATFLILGDICTRRCHYCSVETGRPLGVDREEPRRVAEAVQALRVVGRLDDGVCRNESPNLRVVVAGAVEIQTGGVEFLAGEFVLDGVSALVGGK